MMTSQNVNYDQNWCGNTVNMQRSGESNPTSPHSIASEESMGNDTLHSLMNSSNRPLGFDPLTPPGNPGNMYVPRAVADWNIAHPTTPSRCMARSSINSTALTPIHTPPIDQTPPKSPKSRSDASEKDCTDNDNSSLSGDESKSIYSDYIQEITIPKVNSHGKIKTHKCKHCDYVGVTKKDFWEHSKQHIKPERQIQCTKCPFVTEFKHHYEYHLRNHEGLKPFKCPECPYSCVNKSMLNSHLKSHSDIYQYRCQNCNYATKYVHSLKLHLRKYEHQPAIPLDTEGIPDSAPIIDVYGTRRGPKKRSPKGSKRNSKQKVQKSKEITPKFIDQIPQQIPSMPNQKAQQQPIQIQNLLSSSILHQNPHAMFYNYLNMQMLQQLAATQLSPNQNRNGHDIENIDLDDKDHDMDMINGNRLNTNVELDITYPESPTSSVPNNNSLNNSRLSKTGDDNQHFIDKSHETKPDNSSTPSKPFHCKFCGILFEDAVLHTIHMGYHGYNDVFTCNMCGEKCSDRISFHLHIAKKEHS